MAANAYVLVNVEPARTQEVLDRLNNISGAAVREVLGPYDVVVDWRRARWRTSPRSCATASAP